MLNEEEFSLSRSGGRIPLEPRAFCVLLVLIKNHGRLLDKKALLDAVWKDTFVEETTLIRSIAVIRKQLQDDPRTPEYIETVPTRGYRFIAPVEIRQPGGTAFEASVVPAAMTVANAEIEESSQSSVASPLAALASALRSRFTGRRSLYVAGAVCTLIVASALLLTRKPGAQPLNTQDTVVLADFSNTTGDPVFDDALRQGLLVQLEQSPVLRLASDGQVRKTLKMMSLPADATITSAVAREICQRAGGTVALDGSISRLGTEFVIGLRARRCSTGEELAAEQIQFARKEDALNALSRIATSFRTRIGESSASLHDLDTPLAEATTSSLDALKAFSQGIRTFNAKGSVAAIPLFQRATDLDHDFATAHVWLGRMYADTGEDALSIQSTQRAFALRERASDRERYSIDVSYDLLVTGNLEKARAACGAWIQMYPRDVYPRAFLSGILYPAYGQYDTGYQEASEMIAIDPSFVLGYRNAATNLIALMRLHEAEEVLRQAAERKVFLPSFVTDTYRVAFLSNDPAGMKRAMEAAPTNPWLLHYQAATMAREGRLIEAQRLQDEALRLARHGSRHDMESQMLVASAFTKVFYGYPEGAVQQAHAALRLSSSRYVKTSAALVVAMAGRSVEALAMAGDLLRLYPEDTLIRYSYVPSIQAAVALNRHQPRMALEILKETSQFGVSLPLYPNYLRGEAHRALGETAPAMQAFRTIVDHPGLSMNDPIDNLARIGLARTFVRASDDGAAKTLYREIQHRWSSADTHFPLRQQVDLEASRLSERSAAPTETGG